MTDADLLQRYAFDRADDSFAELVRRRIDFVYAAALRQLAGDHHHAKDVTQHVFIDLARKARTLVRHPDLLGWLYTSTRFATLQVIRSEQRRRQREQRHAMDHSDHAGITAPETDSDWENIRAVLDDAMHDLDDRDRRIVLLRFFDQQSFAAIGALIGLSENAAQKSAARALDKLQIALRRRHITTSAAALGAGMAGGSAASAPAGLAATITHTALASVIAGSGATFLAMTAASKTILAAAGIAVVGAVGFSLHQRQATQAALASVATLERQHAGLQAENENLRTRAVAAEQRLQAADDDNAKLIQAAAEVRAAPPVSPRKTAQDFAAMSRSEAYAEINGMLDKQDANNRANPAYRPIQNVPDALIPEAQRIGILEMRARAQARNEHVFVTLLPDGTPSTFIVEPFAKEPLVKMFPALTPEDWRQLDARYAQITAERNLLHAAKAPMAAKK